MKTLIATLVAGLMAGTACAQEQIVVGYSDLDVTTTGGATALYQRIVNASENVCRRESVLGLHGYFMWRGCVREAVTQAVSSLDNPLVTAHHHGDSPGRLYSSRATTK